MARPARSEPATLCFHTRGDIRIGGYVGYGCGNPNINHDWLATQFGYNSVI